MKRTAFWIGLVLILLCVALVVNSAFEITPINFLGEKEYIGGLKKEVWAIVGSGFLGVILLVIGLPAMEK